MLFIDSAFLADITWAFDHGVVRGVTTNPLFLKPAEHLEHLPKILAASTGPVSVQVSGPRETWQAQAKGLFSRDPRIVVKVPCVAEGLRLVHRLYGNRLSFNVTGVINSEQAIVAAASGAGYVSVFWCRSWDAGCNPDRAIRAAKGESAKVIVGSIRKPGDVVEAFAAGADIVTVQRRILEAMFVHPTTEQFIEQCDAEDIKR